MSSNKVATTKQDKEVAQLKHQLRLRSKVITTIQAKINDSKFNVANFVKEMEEKMRKNEELQERIDALLQENKLLGDIIETLKSQLKEIPSIMNTNNDNNIEIDELKQAILDLNDEYENYRSEYRVSEDIKREYLVLKDTYKHSMMSMNEQVFSIEAKLKHMEVEKNEKELKYAAEVTKLSKDLADNDAKMEEMHTRCEFFRKKFIDEAKASLKMQDIVKALTEENKCHIQYMQILEKKLPVLESEYVRVMEDSHKRLTSFRIKSIHDILSSYDDYTDAERERMSIYTLQQEFQHEKAVTSDLKNQLKFLGESKESLQTNLALSRHNLLQNSMKMEELSCKLIAVEEMRIGDLTYIERLEGLLKRNGIMCI